MRPVPRGLRYVTDQAPGIRRVRLPGRKKRGRKGAPPSFRYVGPSGRRVTDARTLERIARLAIPSAYEDVWICTNPRGHLQATGRDEDHMRAAFQQRRKTLLNALTPPAEALGRDPADLLARAGVDPQIRPGDLPLEGFAALSRAVL